MNSTGAGRAFIGSFTENGGRGVIAASVEDATGALTVLGAADTVTNPSFLVPAPGGLLYAVSETDDGAVAAFDVTDTEPRLIGSPVRVGADGPTHLALADGHVATANYTSGSVSVLPLRASDGGPIAPATVLQHRGGGPVQDRQEGPHAHQVKWDPSGRWLLSVDLGTDSVWVYALDPATGAVREQGESALRAGSGPRHLTFHPAGSHAYVINELEPTLAVCRWDGESGSLESLGETSLLPDGDRTETFGSEVVVAPDGRFIWAATRGHDSISVFTLDRKGERPELVTTVGCGGRWPRDLVLDPTGRRLYAANERSGDVTWFDIDAGTGVPRRAGSLEAPAVSCVVFA